MHKVWVRCTWPGIVFQGPGLLVKKDLGQSLKGLNADLEDKTPLKGAYKSELSL